MITKKISQNTQKNIDYYLKKDHRINGTEIKREDRESLQRDIATCTCGRRPFAGHTCRPAWSSSWVDHGCVARAPGRGRRLPRRRPAPWWRQPGSRPCRATSSTTACGRAPASSSGRTCTRRGAAATCPSSRARTQPALRQNHQRKSVGRSRRRRKYYAKQRWGKALTVTPSTFCTNTLKARWQPTTTTAKKMYKSYNGLAVTWPLEMTGGQWILDSTIDRK